jgi:hypothetical protein
LLNPVACALQEPVDVVALAAERKKKELEVLIS